MRGDEEGQEGFIVFESLEDRVPEDHPLRSIRRLVDKALREMSPLFDSLYAEKGRVSIPPECLLRALVLQTLYGIPSERKLFRARGIQPALPLVRGPAVLARSLAPHELHQEPGPYPDR